MNNPDKTTVLVVEDEALIRLYGAGVLQDAGFDVLEAATADEAIAILKCHDEVRLLFSDIDMPGSMDGLELARQVHERWPGIRLLLTSGFRQISVDVFPDDGEFLRKPWGEDLLVDRVRALLVD